MNWTYLKTKVKNFYNAAVLWLGRFTFWVLVIGFLMGLTGFVDYSFEHKSPAQKTVNLRDA